ncbi:MAG: hypothetical protein HZB67_01280 [Candidatus Aenigmarchaeota archaeon]|nr:hypothetical protein [Candidatus Aenigmarchaeota archaeon]
MPNNTQTKRTLKERIIDKLLLLYILGKYKFDGKIKLHKAIFFAEKTTNEKKIKVFNFNFIRYNFGEYSNELQTDYRELVDNGFLFDTRPIEITDEGKELLSRCEGIIDRNEFILNAAEPLIEHVATLPLDKVKEMAYEKIIISGRKVADIEIGTPLLSNLDESEAKAKILIKDDWIEKLDIIFSRGFVVVDEDTKKEYGEIYKIMKPKIRRVLVD